MAKETQTAPPQKGKTPPGLKPREPVKVPKELFKSLSPEIQELLRKLNAARESGDEKAQREARKNLRAKGFYLSNIEGGGAPPEKKAKAKGDGKAKTTAKVDEEEETEEEEDE